MKPIYRIVFFVLLAITIAQGLALYLNRRALWKERIDAANSKAALDRTRTHIVADGIVAERLMQQMRVQLSDALRQKGQTDQALVRVQLERDKLIAQVPALLAIDTTDGVPGLELHGVFDARDSLGVYIGQRTSVRGVMSIIPEPSALTRFEVYVEPVTLDVAVSCRDHDAVAQVSGPRWARIDLSRVEAKQEICNPKPPSWRPLSLQAPSLPWAAALVGAGFVLRSALPR
jgi:hypothetical protein